MGSGCCNADSGVQDDKGEIMTITLTREEAQQVLDALDNQAKIFPVRKAIETLRARLAQPEQRTGDCLLTGVCAAEGHRIQKARREWQGLTDEEIRNEAKNHVFDESFFSGAIWARGQIIGKNNE